MSGKRGNGPQKAFEASFAENWRICRFGNLIPADIPEPQIHKMYGVVYREWRGDFMWFEPFLVSVECDGIFYRRKDGISRHQTGIGYTDRCKMMIATQRRGWYIYPITQHTFRLDPAGHITRIVEILQERRQLFSQYPGLLEHYATFSTKANRKKAKLIEMGYIE